MLATRRAFTDGAAKAMALTLGLGPLSMILYSCVQAAPKEKVAFRWRVMPAHQQAVQDSLMFDGRVEQERDTKGLPLAIILVGVALLPSLADAILTLRRKLLQPGLIIDTRGTEIKIDVEPRLPRGAILLVNDSGSTLYEPDQLTQSAELAKAIAAAMGK